MVFNSKKDIWMGLIIWVVIILFIKMLYDSIMTISIVGIVIAIVLILFIGSIWFFTRYLIEDDKLIVQYGFMKQTIEIQQITSLRKTRSIFTAPALSMRRIDVNYHPYETTQISPKDEALFIEKLLEINPNIRIDDT